MPLITFALTLSYLPLVHPLPTDTLLPIGLPHVHVFVFFCELWSLIRAV